MIGRAKFEKGRTGTAMAEPRGKFQGYVKTNNPPG